MSSQYFRITRAPEAPPLLCEQLRRALYKARIDTEWSVSELVDTDRCLMDVRVASYCRALRAENEALRDAINALHDLVSGDRCDYDAVIDMLNGAMRIPEPPAPRVAELEQEGSTVYELCDTSDDEAYYTLGLYRTLDEAIAACEDGPPCLEHAEEYAAACVYRREIGQYGRGKIVFERSWVARLDDDSDNFVWVRSEREGGAA